MICSADGDISKKWLCRLSDFVEFGTILYAFNSQKKIYQEENSKELALE